MSPEKIPSQDGAGSQVPEQLNFDFDEAALRARAKELRREHGWTEQYAMSVATMEMKRKQWEASDHNK